MKKSLQKKLKSYSALTGTMVAGGMVNGQIIYTDVNPDLSFHYPFTYQLDLNNDGKVEFIIQPMTVSSTSGTSNAIKVKVIPEDTLSNGVFDSVNAVNADASWLAIAHSTNDVIGAGITSWEQGGKGNSIGTMGLKLAYANSMSYGGYFLGMSDKYVGLRFADTLGNTYYGWARLNVDGAAYQFTIKDYAYNSKSADSIICALPVTTGVSENAGSENNVIIFSSDNVINVNLSDSMPIEGTITVIDILGQEIEKRKITNTQTLIPMNNNKTGIYFVTVSENKGLSHFTKKVIIN